MSNERVKKVTFPQPPAEYNQHDEERFRSLVEQQMSEVDGGLFRTIEGAQGSGSGFDADTVDGSHAADLANIVEVVSNGSATLTHSTTDTIFSGVSPGSGDIAVLIVQATSGAFSELSFTAGGIDTVTGGVGALVGGTAVKSAVAMIPKGGATPTSYSAEAFEDDGTSADSTVDYLLVEITV